jgi:hypothetical protein
MTYECRNGHECIGYDTTNCLYPPKEHVFIPPERVRYIICSTTLEHILKIRQYPLDIITVTTISGSYSIEELGIIGYGSTPDAAWNSVNSVNNGHTSRMTEGEPTLSFSY